MRYVTETLKIELLPQMGGLVIEEVEREEAIKLLDAAPYKNTLRDEHAAQYASIILERDMLPEPKPDLETCYRIGDELLIVHTEELSDKATLVRLLHAIIIEGGDPCAT